MKGNWWSSTPLPSSAKARRWRWWKSSNLSKASLYLTALSMWFFTSCTDLVDLTPLSLETYPAQSDSIIDCEDSLWIRFSLPMNPDRTEPLFSVKDEENAPVALDTEWKEENALLILIPREPWKRGARYRLIGEGTAKSERGTRHPIHLNIPFFAGSSDLPLTLLWVSPQEGNSVGLTTPLVFHFSRSLNPTSFEAHFSLSPSSEYEISFNQDNTEVTITPSVTWEGLTTYTWRTGKEVTDTEGISISHEYEGSFRTLEDTTPPSVEGLYTTSKETPDPSSRMPLEMLDNERGILIRFSEAMQQEKLEQLITLEPSLDVDIIPLTPSTVFLSPQQLWEPEGTYTLTISGDITDISGNTMGEEFHHTFTIEGIPAQRLESVTLQSEHESYTYTQPDWGSETFLPAVVGIDSTLTVILTFSQPFTEEEAQRLVDAVSLEPFFPYYLSNPECVRVTSLPDSKQVTFEFHEVEGVDSDDPGYLEYWYLLKIKGGPRYFINETGSYLLEDLTIRLSLREM
ncbi:Ig-like domain-containing protein [Spirochaeta thermophila]|uniref:SbsA Ig-like domain-containing protein n=1 Tax=Winmispira thermophila (strain ATCC 49972 / DSM 6192 / RI 19.B1) TaxID=665571 RepID=E0RQI5_WINT6|nr:Ig-like domain-containing protein [Spirochaeta thermophila]ADN02961.1 hypothetical protein STHERM_c20260 [Spirochaeta thermophila DSM 6192]